jgi:hypothetical protein
MEHRLEARRLIPMAGDVGFVEVIFAKSVDEAEDHRTTLVGRSIPAFVEPTPEEPAQSGVAVFVPSNRLIEASEVLTMSAHDDIENDSDILDNPDLDDFEEDSRLDPLVDDDDLDDEDRESLDSDEDDLYDDDDDDF